MSDTNTTLPPIDWAAWIVETREKAKIRTQEELAGLLDVAKSVVASAESGQRPASTGLVARVTYCTMRGDLIGSIEKVWSREWGRPIAVARPESAGWYYELEPFAQDAAPEYLAMAVHLFKTVLIEAKANASRYGRRRVTDVVSEMD